MRRLSALGAFIILGIAAMAAPYPKGLRFDVAGTALLNVTVPFDGPVLPHTGLGAAAGLEIDCGSLIPLRFELGGIIINPSAISSGGELYRGWNGFRSAFYAGYRWAPLINFAEGRFGILLGGALTAAGYQGTNLAFAYPSLAANLRFDPKAEAERGFFAAIPLELMFRGTDLGLAAGISIGWRAGPERTIKKAESEESMEEGE